MPKAVSGAVTETAPETQTLAQLGVTNELAKQAPKAAAMSEEEADVKKAIAVAVACVDRTKLRGNRPHTNLDAIGRPQLQIL
jgi:hypothetical protein